MFTNYEILRLERYFLDPKIGDSVMKPHISSAVCRNIRIALRSLGYSIPENDKYDEELQKAVQSFQADNKHKSKDGYVGPGTRRLLTQKLKEEFGSRVFSAMKYPEGEAFPLIFLSYAHEDITMARRLFNDLQEAGVHVWFDNESLLPGQKWKVAIEWAIRNSRVLLSSPF